MPTHASSSRFLARALQADAVISGATGVLMLAGGGLAAPLLGLPEALLRGAGLALLPFAGAVYWAAQRPAAGAVRAILGVNIAWVVASLLLLVSGLVAPTLLGHAFVLAQALAVAGFALLQVSGLRRLTGAAADAQPASL